MNHCSTDAMMLWDKSHADYADKFKKVNLFGVNKCLSPKDGST